ncbi:MAG: ShlB/FhaC/HecB family hemolysin secretion/activation protein [Thiomicrospira sp.]|jgi:hemolysin activation/secretion protein|nr:ShlB/FhaC/HecB family hemolysin secretion/activation protein [Thiomicrospira sp.]
MMKTQPTLLTLALASIGMVAQAATPPDAGQILQETMPQTIQPIAPSVTIDVPTQPLLDERHGGQKVTLNAINITGNIAFSAEQLNAVLGDIRAEPKDLADMRHLANLISLYYRNNGYPFARAYLPAQKLSDGVLNIAVLEGRYGQLVAKGELGEQVQPFLNQIQSGDLIESSQLERTTLIIGDLPGIRVSPVMKPGQNTGEGDLDLQVEQDKRYNGAVIVDNHGNRYTSAYRAMLNVNANRLFTLGDELNVTGLVTDEKMWFGNAGYSLPLGYSGLRGKLSYVRTSYELTKEYKNLDAIGIADIVSAGLSYPLKRSQTTNIILNGQIERKSFVDEVRFNQTKKNKSAIVIPLSVNFDHRDALGAGGITYGSVSASWGDINLETASERQTDKTTARTQGSFYKLNLDAARIQNIGANFSAYIRIAGQWANKNLDSSEDMSLGGPRGVRAYPQGEASGDQAMLGQIELRYNYKMLTPYAFYDAGRISVNTSPWSAGNNTREISGAGLGLRVSYQAWSADIAAAWRNGGGKPQSDTRDDSPRIWASASYRF